MDDDKINSVNKEKVGNILQGLYRLAYPMVPHGIDTTIFHDAIKCINFLTSEMERYITMSNSLVEHVLSKLPSIPDLQDKQMVESEVRYLLGRGWNVQDVILYIYSMEEVSPGLDEDVAISRMNQIRSKYS